jgi:hypothetical protein
MIKVAGLIAGLRRLSTRRRTSATTVTVTRVVGTHHDPDTGEPVEDTVTVTTAPPEPDLAAYRLARAALAVAAVAAAVAIVSAVWRVMRGAVI